MSPRRWSAGCSGRSFLTTLSPTRISQRRVWSAAIVVSPASGSYAPINSNSAGPCPFRATSYADPDEKSPANRRSSFRSNNNTRPSLSISYRAQIGEFDIQSPVGRRQRQAPSLSLELRRTHADQKRNDFHAPSHGIRPGIAHDFIRPFSRNPRSRMLKYQFDPPPQESGWTDARKSVDLVSQEAE